MRRAEFVLPAAKKADEAVLVVHHFPGMGGSVQANLTRWSRQFRPEPDKKGAAPQIKSREINGLKIHTVYHEGTFLKPKRPMAMGGPKDALPGYALMGAIVETKTGPWFFKVTGPKKTVSGNRKLFEVFLQSMKLKS